MSFSEIRYNPTSPLSPSRPPDNKALQGMELYDKFADRFQVMSKVQSPVVSKAKV